MPPGLPTSYLWYHLDKNLSQLSLFSFAAFFDYLLYFHKAELSSRPLVEVICLGYFNAHHKEWLNSSYTDNLGVTEHTLFLFSVIWNKSSDILLVFPTVPTNLPTHSVSYSILTLLLPPLWSLDYTLNANCGTSGKLTGFCEFLFRFFSMTNNAHVYAKQRRH